jgi:diacylglycerol kinase family enzyme
MPGIGIIINPYARAHKRRPMRAQRLGFIVGDKGSCHETKDLLDVERLAQEFKESGVEILGLSGGDGTIHKTLTTFIKVYGSTPLPKIALLRGGTMNLLANTLNIYGTPEKLLSNLILKYHEGIPSEEIGLNMLHINDSYGFVFGMGIAGRFIEKYNELKNGDPTPWCALRLLLRLMASSIFHTKFCFEMNERFDAKITIDGRPAPFKNYTFIIAGKVEGVGLNFRPLYRARETAENFHMVAISASPMGTIRVFPRALLGKPPRSENVFETVGSKMIIELDKPQSYMIDGDMPEKTDRIEITTGPCIRVIIPSAQ